MRYYVEAKLNYPLRFYDPWLDDLDISRNVMKWTRKVRFDYLRLRNISLVLWRSMTLR